MFPPSLSLSQPPSPTSLPATPTSFPTYLLPSSLSAALLPSSLLSHSPPSSLKTRVPPRARTGSSGCSLCACMYASGGGSMREWVNGRSGHPPIAPFLAMSLPAPPSLIRNVSRVHSLLARHHAALERAAAAAAATAASGTAAAAAAAYEPMGAGRRRLALDLGGGGAGDVGGWGSGDVARRGRRRLRVVFLAAHFRCVSRPLINYMFMY